MSIVISFPATINYRLVSIERDGRLMIEILATGEHFIMSIEALLAKPYIVRHLSKVDVKYVCDVAYLNRCEKDTRVLDNQQTIDKKYLF